MLKVFVIVKRSIHVQGTVYTASFIHIYFFINLRPTFVASNNTNIEIDIVWFRNIINSSHSIVSGINYVGESRLNHCNVLNKLDMIIELIDYIIHNTTHTKKHT